MSRLSLLVVSLAISLCPSTTVHAQIYRWDNGQVIPGTEAITLGPDVRLNDWKSDDHNLRYGDFSGNLDLTNAAFSSSWLDNAHFHGANLTRALFDYAIASNSDFAGTNLAGASAFRVNLTNADLQGAVLNGASLFRATLTGANLQGAHVAGANFSETTSRGFTKEQLYSTASYQAKNLQGIELNGNNVAAWDFSGQNIRFAHFDSSNLTKAQLYSTSSYHRKDLEGISLDGLNLTGWDFSGQNVRWTTLGNTLTQSQLYSTASYQNKDLEGISFSGLNLTAWDLSGQNLSYAWLDANLTKANLTDAIVTGVRFPYNYGGFTREQLYSTASYKNKNLQGMLLSTNSAWDFRGQYLANATFYRQVLAGSDLRGADLRAARFDLGVDTSQSILGNTILDNGNLATLDVPSGESFLVRDHDAYSVLLGGRFGYAAAEMPAIAVKITNSLTLAPNSQLELRVRDADWHSTIKVQTGVPVTIAGADLEITFERPATAVPRGQIFNLFDWAAPLASDNRFAAVVTPLGTAWDTSQLYTTGDVVMLGVSSDLNGDQDVDSDDLLGFLANWTGADYPKKDKTWLDGDSDADGDVDSADMLVVLVQWTGAAAAEGTSRSVSVPEPSCVLLIGMAFAGLMKDLRERAARR